MNPVGLDNKYRTGWVSQSTNHMTLLEGNTGGVWVLLHFKNLSVSTMRIIREVMN